jgi:hypothetical protein
MQQTDNPTTNKPFENHDLGLSAALLSCGFELTQIDKSNIRKVVFVFRRSNGIEDAVNQYFSNKLEVLARNFFDNIKALKNSIYNG